MENNINNNLLNEEMYLYKPSSLEVKEGEDDKIFRLIFDGLTEFEDFENKLIDKFFEFAKINNNEEILKISRSYILRFLEACKLNIKITYKAIIENLIYVNYIKNLKTTNEHIEYLNKGGIYIYGRDAKYHPNFILNVSKLHHKEYKIEFILDCISIVIEFMLKNMLIDGQIENFNIIIDVSNINLLKLPLKKIKLIVRFLQDNYRNRSYKVFIVNTGFSIKVIWALVKPMLDKNTLKKIMLTKKSTDQQILNIFNLNQLEKKYGGNLENKENNYFPPESPNNDYIKDNIDNIYYTKDEYKEKFKDFKVKPDFYDSL